jgi:hypothetical protein
MLDWLACHQCECCCGWYNCNCKHYVARLVGCCGRAIDSYWLLATSALMVWQPAAALTQRCILAEEAEQLNARLAGMPPM